MSNFRTVKVSDPRFENDGLRHVTVKSKNLQGRGNVTFFIPPGPITSPPAMTILLHGVYGSHLSWAMSAGVHRTALNLIQTGRLKPMVLAMPSDGLWGDGSGYLTHIEGDFERWIVHDVVGLAREVIPEVTEVSPLFIAGLSMGGFGALRLGAKYGHMFRAISGLSSITELSQMELFVEEQVGLYRQEDPTDESVLATMLKYRQQLPAIRFDCGTSDLLIEHNRELHRQLQAHDIPHHYQEFPGSHEWPYWEQHITDTLLFFDRFCP